MTKIVAPTEKQDSFIIRDVLYQQWQPGYCIRRITVTSSDVIFSVEIAIARRSGFSPYVLLHGIGLDKTWHLETQGAIIYASAIKNVRFDGVLSLDAVARDVTYCCLEPGNRISVLNSTLGKTSSGKCAEMYTLFMPTNAKMLSCDLVFPKGDYINGTINLYEGDMSDQARIEYWHFLRVNMLLNREPF